MLSSSKSALPGVLCSWVAGTAALPRVRVGASSDGGGIVRSSPGIYADGTETVAAPCAASPGLFPRYVARDKLRLDSTPLLASPLRQGLGRVAVGHRATHASAAQPRACMLGSIRIERDLRV